MDVLISVFSVSVSIIAVLFSFLQYKETTKRERRQLTIEEYNKLQEQALDSINSKSDGEIKNIAKDFHSEEYKNLCSAIAKCDHFSACVNEGIYDEALFIKISKYHFPNVYKKLEPIIKVARKGNNRGKSFEDFEILSNRVLEKNKTGKE